MEEINLEVPYASQWDADAQTSRDNCGPTSIKMVLEFYGEKNLTTDQIFKLTGASANGLISISQLQTAIKALGYTSTYEVGVTPQRIQDVLAKGVVPIALVHYGDFSSRQDTGFSGGHLFPVDGFRSDGYFVNDPDFIGAIRSQGDHHFYTKKDFEKGWGDCSIDGNPNNSLLLILPKVLPPTPPTPATDDTPCDLSPLGTEPDGTPYKVENFSTVKAKIKAKDQNIVSWSDANKDLYTKNQTLTDQVATLNGQILTLQQQLKTAQTATTKVPLFIRKWFGDKV